MHSAGEALPGRAFSPMVKPDEVDVVIFRENTEDIYAGIEFKEGSADAAKLREFVNSELLGMGKKQLRDDAGLGIKPISVRGSKRLVRAALQYAVDQWAQDRDDCAQGKHPEVYRGCVSGVGLRGGEGRVSRPGGDGAGELDFCGAGEESQARPWRSWRRWWSRVSRLRRRALARRSKPRSGVCCRSMGIDAWWRQVEEMILVNDRICDAMFQDLLLKPSEYSVLATTNLNGDYLSDAAAAQVGGLGIAPGVNVGDGFAVFEATHGTAPAAGGPGCGEPGIGDLVWGVAVRVSGVERGGEVD